MHIIHGNDTSFLSSIPPLATQFFVHSKQAHAYLVDPNGKHFASRICEPGSIAIDFLYDSLFEQVTNFLAESSDIVYKINSGIDVQKQWTYFEIFNRVLFNNGHMHPFYYPLFVDVSNAFRLGMSDADGTPLREDFFVQKGEALAALKHRVAALLDAQDDIEDLSQVVPCYHQNAFQSPLPLPNLQAEFIVTSEQNTELVMVSLPQSPEEIWNYLLPTYAILGIRFKRCEHCKRFFATTGRGNPKFCERIIEGTGKSCRQVMPKQNFNNKGKTDPAVWLYTRAYKTMYSRVSNGAMQKDMFHEWAKRARDQRDACSLGQITPEAYSAWLCKNGLHIDYLKESN